MVGFSDFVPELEQILLPNSPHNILLISGIGGIGKSTLAAAIARSLISQPKFQLFTWINADKLINESPHLEIQIDLLRNHLQSEFLAQDKNSPAALQDCLASQTCLVVIDGINEESPYDTFLKELQQFPQSTKFIITSRRRPTSEQSSYQFSLGELNEENAARLIDVHSNQIGLGEQADFLAKNFTEIYKWIGGNPLAIKLMIGLLHTYPLQTILKDLKRVKIKDTEKMYRYIYWQAWNPLDESAKKLLAAMPLIAEEGAGISMLLFITKMDEEQIYEAVQSLLTRSLIEYRGAPDIHRYGIHHLTRSFLQTEIVKWPKS